MQQFVFWASYLFLPLLLASLVFAAKATGSKRRIAVLAFIAFSILVYARFVEPHILRVEHTEIALEGAVADGPKIKIALFSDTHFGVFRNAVSMQRIVDRLAHEAPDAVMIAGDILYYSSPDDIPAELAALADLRMPIFAVLGNHDVGFPGPIYTKDLYAALTDLGVILVENRAQLVTLANQQVVVAGASDLWEQRQDFAFSANLPDAPIFLLTHNPDTAFEAPAGIDYDLMLAGHTHGAQIRLPGLIDRVIPTRHSFDKGLHPVKLGAETRRVFVTPGTGMVGLPFRFNMPPRIDILTIVVR